MNAISLLTQQHDEVDAMIATIETTKDAKLKHATFVKLADSLAAHITIEEKLFYPIVMAKRTEDKLHEAVEEHLGAKRLLADLLALRVDDPQFDAKISVLKEGLDHHNHKEEENKLFPIVRTLLGADELTALGGELLAMFESLMADDPRRHIPAETAQAAALPSVRS